MLSSDELLTSVQRQINGDQINGRHTEDVLSDNAAAQCLISLRTTGNGLGNETFKQDQPPQNNNQQKGNIIKSLFPSSDGPSIRKKLEDTSTIVKTVEKCISHESKLLIDTILQQIKKLSAVEKLLLFLKLPTGQEVPNPLKQPINALGSRPEIGQTIMWIKTHLCEDKDTSLPKQDVYNEYMEYCNRNGMKALSTADFGKVMKQVYVNVRPRRLGTRGNSRYCYAGMAKREILPPPALPVIPAPSSQTKEGADIKSSQDKLSEEQLMQSRLICHWASRMLGKKVSSFSELTEALVLVDQGQLPISEDCTSKIFQNGLDYVSSCRVAKPNNIVKTKQTPVMDSKRKSQEDCLANGKVFESSCSKSKKGRKGQQQHQSCMKKSVNGVSSVKASSSGSDSNAATSSVHISRSESSSGEVLNCGGSAILTNPLDLIDPSLVLSNGKVAIPRLMSALTSIPPALPPSSSAPPTPSPIAQSQRHHTVKPLQQKPEPDSNSLEMEEELLKYFQHGGDDEPKLGHLKMLLEKRPMTGIPTTSCGIRSASVSRAAVGRSGNNTGKSLKSSSASAGVVGTAGRRVSFDTASGQPDPPPAASFVPISPVVTAASTSSVGIACTAADQDTSIRSQSVPMVTALPILPSLISPHSSSVQFPLADDEPEQTPVPAELVDFDDSIHHIFSMMDVLRDCHSYPGTPAAGYVGDPVVSAFPRNAKSYPCTPSEARPLSQLPPRPPPLIDTDLSLLPEDLYLECDDTFNNLAREMSSAEYVLPD